MPKVIFLQAAEFISKTKELHKNGHKNIFGFSVVLELKVENSKILTFKVIFLCQKSTESFSIFFIEEYKKGEQLLLLSFFDNFDF